MTNAKTGIIAGVAVLTLGIVSLIISFDYGYYSEIGPGPGFFPVWISGILIVLAILYIIENLRGKNVSSEEWPAGQSLKQVLFIIMSLLVFFVLFLLAGYIVAGIVFLSMVFWKEYKWYVAVLLSAGITLIFYVLFNHLLKVHLPIGGMLF
ncbi:tripartite tricarboxylate transporter TctB family protein [Ureibacillus sp. FSL K6-8385]|uniref:tripartite tricarboxylate transporter TctB family protein n=1 Tax=Ureibacillus TaxID=160795 RepID=UPI0015EEC59C|nr:tripartite tricarboxylate transporter TctB family protein [Ureibacillus terrenus]MED3763150.1 tripartite tricarboxylate transporter TctB family protein [Ureibacillus terrenus]